MAFNYNTTGGIPPYTYSKLSGDLPSGLTLNADGSITGTATAAGEYSWTVRVVDSTGLADTLPDTCIVTEPSVTTSLLIPLRGFDPIAGEGLDSQLAVFVLDETAWTIGTAQTVTSSNSSAYGVMANRTDGSVIYLSANSPIMRPFVYSNNTSPLVAGSIDVAGSVQPFDPSVSPDGQIFVVRGLGYYNAAAGAFNRISTLTVPNGSRWTADSSYHVGSGNNATVMQRAGSVITQLSAGQVPAGFGATNYTIGITPDGQYMVSPGSGSGQMNLIVYSNDGDGSWTYVRTITTETVDLLSDRYFRDVCFTSDGQLMFVALDASPYIAIFSHDGAGNFTRLAAPTGLPVSGQSISIATDDNVVSMSNTSNNPYLFSWIIDRDVSPSSWVKVTMPTLPTNYTVASGLRTLCFMPSSIG